LQPLKAGWAGKSVTWTVSASAENGMSAELQVPKQVIRDLVKMLTVDSHSAPTQQVVPGLP
jgi:hypothetical protein